MSDDPFETEKEALETAIENYFQAWQRHHGLPPAIITAWTLSLDSNTLTREGGEDANQWLMTHYGSYPHLIGLLDITKERLHRDNNRED